MVLYRSRSSLTQSNGKSLCAFFFLRSEHDNFASHIVFFRNELDISRETLYTCVTAP